MIYCSIIYYSIIYYIIIYYYSPHSFIYPLTGGGGILGLLAAAVGRLLAHCSRCHISGGQPSGLPAERGRCRVVDRALGYRAVRVALRPPPDQDGCLMSTGLSPV